MAEYAGNRIHTRDELNGEGFCKKTQNPLQGLSWIEARTCNGMGSTGEGNLVAILLHNGIASTRGIATSLVN